MEKKLKIKQSIKQIKRYFTIVRFLIKSYYRQIFLLLILSVILSFIEIGGVTAIAPFLSILANQELILSDSYLRTIYTLLGFSNVNSFFVLFGFALILFYALRALYDIFFNYRVSKFINKFYYEIIVKIIDKYIHMPYQSFVNQNTSNLTKTVVTEVNQIKILLYLSIIMISEIMVFIFVYVALFIINWKITFTLSLITGIIFLVFSLTISLSIKRQGDKREKMHKILFKKISELFGNFKIIKFLPDNARIMKEFTATAQEYSQTNLIKELLAVIPKNVMEAIGFLCLIGLIEVALFKHIDITRLLPTITVFALAMNRLLPASGKIFNSFNNIIFFSKSLDRVYDELVAQEEEGGYEDIEFKDEIVLKNISFSYDQTQRAINGVNLTIKKGSRIAFAGESGGGKSTLADLISGIYMPSEGEILVDGNRLSRKNIGTWRSKIGYIPQSIYLLDDTVTQNITFGLEYDENRVIEVLKKAKIYDFLQGKKGLKTKVGDGGIMISGGQKQRIGIARALYTDPEILILDEPTSALDYETEKQIIDEIYESCKDKTIIIIAHRMNTIESCDRICFLEKGNIMKEVIGKNIRI